MKKVIIITGCLGFIGSYITRLCLVKGWYVKGIDSCTYASNPNLLTEFNTYKNFSFEKKDINDLNFLWDCDYIINCAAETHVCNSIVGSDEFIHSNITGVHHLLELLRNYRQEGRQKPTLLHFSTDEVYGDISNGRHKETDILKPSNPYSSTKAAADMLIMAWARTYNINYIIVRPTNNYGIGQYIEKLIPKTCKSISLGRKIPLHNEGKPIRNWLHVEDTAEAIVTIIEKGKVNEIYNINGNLEQSNLETVKKVFNLYYPHEDWKIENFIDLSYSRQGQDVRYSLDDTKLKALGWKPKRIFDEELEKITDFYLENFIW